MQDLIGNEKGTGGLIQKAHVSLADLCRRFFRNGDFGSGILSGSAVKGDDAGKMGEDLSAAPASFHKPLFFHGNQISANAGFTGEKGVANFLYRYKATAFFQQI